MAGRTITIIRERDEKGSGSSKPRSAKRKSDDEKIDKEKVEKEKEKVEKSLLDKLIDSDDVTLALDVVSALGVAVELTGYGAVIGGPVSMAADIVNAVRMAAKGDFFKAGLYALFAVPVFGDVLQGTKVAGLVGEGGVELIMKLISLAKAERLVQATATFNAMIDKIPGNDGHKEKVKDAVGVFMSGDAAKIADLAEKSDDKELAAAIMAKAGEATAAGSKKKELATAAGSEKKELAESRRSRSLLPLYKRSLYSGEST